MNTKYFIWVQGYRGPEAQLCQSLPVDGSGKPKPYLACHAVDASESLSQCIAKYPYEAKP